MNNAEPHAIPTATSPGPSGPWTPFDWRASGSSIPGRVRALALQHPERPAVFDTTATLDCGALDRASNRVANALLAAGDARAEAIVLLFDVGVTAIVAALGVLKAGKHFVGVEPTFPEARIVEIADDAAATFVLTNATHRRLASDVAGSTRIVVDLDALGDVGDHAPGISVSLDAIALLNYTSGSTGKPKGVVHTHRSAMAHSCRYGNAFRLCAEDRLASFGSLAWAGSFWDAFGSLCFGAALGAYDVRRHGVHELPAWLERTGITVVCGMTVARRLAFDFAALRLPRVRLVQLGGDTVYRRDVEACQRVFPNATMAVGLGTTEAGRVAEQFIAPGIVPEEEVVPVGFPTAGVAIAVVDDGGVEVGPGDIGEIVATSDEHAAGYRNLPAVTADRFRPEPGATSSVRYFTGDLGRWLPDGKLQHLGRKDFQIKVHGYAVAANEVEARLLAVPGVREACVVARQSVTGIDELVAFVVRDVSGSPATSALRERLLLALPEYMVPRRFVDLDALPRTTTGKIDRNRLPSIAVSCRDVTTPYAAPRSAIEAALAAMWAEVLGLDVVGIDDDFVALGGDSLGATQVANRVLRDFAVEVPLGELLARPTVAAMAAFVAMHQDAGTIPAAPPAIRARGR